MNNETLERLRPLGVWVLLGAAGASQLAGLIRLIVGMSDGSFSGGVASASGHFFGLWTTALIAGAVALALSSERTRSAVRPVVITAMVMAGIGLVFAAIHLITGFIGVYNPAYGFANLFSTLASGAVLGVVGFGLLKVFKDPALVPQAPAQPQYNQGFPQATGQQQAYAYDPQQAYQQQVYG
ncbi:hypothetical protein ACFHWE_22410, partial [Nocardiopsis sp. LOL_012]